MTVDRNESYSGDSSYRYVDKLIKNNDRELMIVSPYISDYYIRMLLRKGNKQIRIITSNSSTSYKGTSINKYIMGGTKGYVKATIFFLLLDLISIYLKFSYTTIILSAIVMVLLILAIRKFAKYGSNIKVKVSKGKFIHEKLYIGREIAIVGSANLTYNGMHRNLEHIDVIRDRERIDGLKEHFEQLWSKN